MSVSKVRHKDNISIFVHMHFAAAGVHLAGGARGSAHHILILFVAGCCIMLAGLCLRSLSVPGLVSEDSDTNPFTVTSFLKE